MEKIIARGAEAVLFRDGSKLIKRRISKGYRIEEIDNKVRKLRTRSEAKILKKLDFVPEVFDYNDKKMEIEMEFIEGDLVRDILDNLGETERKKICIEIGEKVGKIHDLDIIHGDLTTSNFILKQPFRKALAESKVYFIDFGLGFVSSRIEDKATDMRLLKQALESKHYKNFEKSYGYILQGYKKSKNSKEVLDWLEKKVEKRGRYKGKK